MIAALSWYGNCKCPFCLALMVSNISRYSISIAIMVCSSESSVDSVRNHMSKMNVRHRPVVDNGKLMGIVSIGDVLKYRIDELKHGVVHVFNTGSKLRVYAHSDLIIR